jgi:signal transduction histidine kinase
MSPSRILVVEDESIVALDIGERLASLGYELAGRAASGEDAVVLAGQERPALVLMDIRLRGDMDGIAAAQHIRAQFRVPVVFLTAYAEDETLDRAKLAEPFGYILKPFADRELKSAIEMALYKHRAEEEIRRIEAEREELQARLRQAQKMEAVGRLAGGVAHDFNNLVTGILHYVELSRDELPQAHPVRAYLEEIATGAQRSADLTRQLLAFARKQTIVPVVLDLNRRIADMLKLLRRLVGEDIDLAWSPALELWPVRMDPSQTDQILMNVCANARDAIAGVGRIAIGTENITLREAGGTEFAGAAPGDYVRLTIADDGSGMAKEVLEHVFEPFFTTKGVGEGIGMGLATVYGIVHQNGGTIGVSSEPGAGTTVCIHLPRVAPAPKVDRPARRPAAHAEGAATVLLVEDERSLRLTCGRFLEGFGYTVLTAASPAAALEVARHHPGEIHLVLTDVVMPGMNGPELARLLQALRPSLRCVFMSGYTANAIVDCGLPEEDVHFLQKPFSRDDLAVKLHEVLAGS